MLEGRREEMRKEKWQRGRRGEIRHTVPKIIWFSALEQMEQYISDFCDRFAVLYYEQRWAAIHVSVLFKVISVFQKMCVAIWIQISLLYPDIGYKKCLLRYCYNAKADISLPITVRTELNQAEHIRVCRIESTPFMTDYVFCYKMEIIVIYSTYVDWVQDSIQLLLKLAKI